jgi:GNAT superfamily N-acetyltransferase
MPRSGRALKDGYIDVPQGRLAAVVTYLEMKSRPQLPPAGGSKCSIRRVESPELDWYRRLYRAVGEQWLWFSRLRMPDEELAALLRHPAIEIYALSVDGADKGLAELDRRVLPEIEIAYFGVTSDLIGQGMGSQLMRHALDQAWSHNPRRVHLHTCTLDHPNALQFYLKWGFRAWKRAVEVAPDPRLTGDSHPAAAPHIPLIGTGARIPTTGSCPPGTEPPCRRW